MAERPPNGKRRAPSRFAADYFDVERLKKREGFDERLHEFAARRPWLLRQTDQQPPSSKVEASSAAAAPPDNSLERALERLQERIENAKPPPRQWPLDTLRAIGESLEFCGEYERMRRRIESMGDELDAME